MIGKGETQISLHSDLTVDANSFQINAACRVEGVSGLEGLRQKLKQQREQKRQLRLQRTKEATPVNPSATEEEIATEEVVMSNEDAGLDTGLRVEIRIRLPEGLKEWFGPPMREALEHALLDAATRPSGMDEQKVSGVITQLVETANQLAQLTTKVEELEAGLEGLRKTTTPKTRKTRPGVFTDEEWQGRWNALKRHQLPDGQVSGLIKYLKRNGVIGQEEKTSRRTLREHQEEIDAFFSRASPLSQAQGQ